MKHGAPDGVPGKDAAEAGIGSAPAAAEPDASLGQSSGDRSRLLRQQHDQQGLHHQPQLAPMLMQTAGWPGAAMPITEPGSASPAASWALGAAQPEQLPSAACVSAAGGSSAAATTSPCGASLTAPRGSPPARLVACAQPLQCVVVPPTSHTAISNPATNKLPARPATAIACSLRSNVPPHVAAMLSGAGRRSADCSMQRPAAAPARRPATAALAAAVAAGGPSLQVTRRSLAGQQQNVVLGKSVSGVQAVIVRGEAGGLPAVSLAQGRAHGAR